MKIGCSTVAFRKYPLDRALSVIRSLGYDYIETQAIHPWCPHADVDSDDPVRYARHIADFGFKGITALWMAHGTLVSDEKSVEYARRSIEWAAAAGIGVVNTGDGFKPEGMSDEKALELLHERISAILETAEKCRVCLAIEPHGSFSLRPGGLETLMNISSSPWLGINYDAANIKRAGYVESKDNAFTWKNAAAGGNEADALGSVADRVVHFHAKDIRAGRCTALGEGDVDLAGCFRILKNHGYNGAVSLETEGEESFDEACLLAGKSLFYLKNLTCI